MKLLLCSVYDSKVSAYAPPFPAKTRGEAIRIFSDAVRDPSTLLSKHPEDYRLFLLGEFDDNSGHIVNSQVEPIIGADELG